MEGKSQTTYKNLRNKKLYDISNQVKDLLLLKAKDLMEGMLERAISISFSLFS